MQKSNEITAAMTTMIQNLSNDFSAEIKSKQDAFDVIQAHLRAATRELAEQRKQIQLWQTRCGELDKYLQRVRNLEQALHDEDRFDWTGRLTVDGLDAGPGAGAAFKWRGTNSTMVALAGSVDISFDLGGAFAEPTLPTGDSAASLTRLRRLKMWHQRAEDLMEARLRNLRGASAEKEFQCKKIVAMCTGVSIDKVEDVSSLYTLFQYAFKLTFSLPDVGNVVDGGRIRIPVHRHRARVRVYAEGVSSLRPWVALYPHEGTSFRFAMV